MKKILYITLLILSSIGWGQVPVPGPATNNYNGTYNYGVAVLNPDGGTNASNGLKIIITAGGNMQIKYLNKFQLNGLTLNGEPSDAYYLETPGFMHGISFTVGSKIFKSGKLYPSGSYEDFSSNRPTVTTSGPNNSVQTWKNTFTLKVGTLNYLLTVTYTYIIPQTRINVKYDVTIPTGGTLPVQLAHAFDSQLNGGTNDRAPGYKYIAPVKNREAVGVRINPYFQAMIYELGTRWNGLYSGDVIQLPYYLDTGGQYGSIFNAFDSDYVEPSESSTSHPDNAYGMSIGFGSTPGTYSTTNNVTFTCNAPPAAPADANLPAGPGKTPSQGTVFPTTTYTLTCADGEQDIFWNGALPTPMIDENKDGVNDIEIQYFKVDPTNENNYTQLFPTADNKLLVTGTPAGAKYRIRYYDNYNKCTSTEREVIVKKSTCANDLGITKTVTDIDVNNTVHPNKTYTIKYVATNNGTNNNTNVKVVDILPAGFSIVTPTPDAGTSYANGTWTIGSLGAGQSKTLTITVTVNNYGPLPSIARISGTNADTLPLNDTSNPVINLDSDSDGIPNITDLDNDNDGILDTTEMYCDQTTAPNGTFPLPADQTLTKQLLFWDWSGTTLSSASPTATKTVIFNGVTYTATITNYISSVVPQTAGNGAQNLIANDILTWGGPAQMIGRFYNVNTTTFKEALYSPANGTGNSSFDITVTATIGGKNYPVDLVVFDAETSNTITAGQKESITFTTNSESFKLLQKTGSGSLTDQYASGVTNISGENTSVVTYNNTQDSNVNALFYTRGFSPKVSTVISRSSNSQQGVGFAVRLYCDTDSDGIPSFLDLDSDGDGCPDAIEGDENVLPAQLNADNSINITANGGVNADGVPNLVNTGGAADIGGDVGQGIGTAANAAANSCSVSAAIRITKDNGQTLYKRPSTSTYTITVANEGSGTVNNIHLTDIVPSTFGTADFDYSATVTSGSTVRKLLTDATGTTVSGTGSVDNYINLLPGGVATYTVKLKISDEKRGDIRNVASIALPGSLVNSLPNTDDDIDSPGIDGRNDSFSNSTINPNKGGVAGVVSANDMIGDIYIDTPTKASYTLNNNGGISGASINTNGELIIPTGVPAGVYTLQYTICSVATPTDCDTASILVEVFVDSDGDGVSDVIDFDDDNDGITDLIEASACGATSTKYFNEDFGTGARANFTDLLGTTNYIYEAGPYTGATLTGIDDGEYALLPDLDNVASWAATPAGINGRAWAKTYDHTSGNGTGRMALFNASRSTSEEFYNVNNITVPTNKSVQLTFWAKNVDLKTMDPYWDKNRSLPNIRVKVLSNGVLIKEFTTGTILRDEQWHLYSVPFNTGTYTNIQFVMYNDMEGGLGNDLALDDIAISTICYSDGDGIPNELDLDSDNDGCTDAIEGAANITASQLVTATGLLATQNPNKNLGNTVDVNGIPTIVNGGQQIGNAFNAAINDCKCIKPAVITGTALDTNVGISTIGTTTGWPQNRKGAYLALESQGKGLVISRLTTTQITAIGVNSQEGMMVYDTDVDCLKIYSKDIGAATYSWKCFDTQSCPDN